jgi:predicted SAM-dependent methyltransferase
MFKVVVQNILCPPKFKYARRRFGSTRLNVLDIGCGNNSFQLAMKWLKTEKYVGVDRGFWGGNNTDYSDIKNLIIQDLEQKPLLNDIQASSIDYIIFSHTIEHLTNGEQVLTGLYDKLKPGGMIYIETPDIATLNYPSAVGFMNFYDDDTHKRIYEINSLVLFMMDLGFRVERYGRRRDLKRIIILSAPMILYNLFYSLPIRRKFDSRGLWDLFGVASFVVARKP